jgi:hypothetical protein
MNALESAFIRVPQMNTDQDKDRPGTTKAVSMRAKWKTPGS